MAIRILFHTFDVSAVWRIQVDYILLLFPRKRTSKVLSDFFSTSSCIIQHVYNMKEYNGFLKKTFLQLAYQEHSKYIFKSQLLIYYDITGIKDSTFFIEPSGSFLYRIHQIIITISSVFRISLFRNGCLGYLCVQWVARI